MSWIGIVFTLVVCVAMPVMAIRAATRLHRMDVKPTLTDVLVSTFITHGIVGVLAVVAAYDKGVKLFPAPAPARIDLVAGAVFLAAALGANLFQWRIASRDELDRMAWLEPRTRNDFLLWAGISLLAGIMEEVIYRGALLGIMQSALENSGWVRDGGGGYWWAVAVCVVAFTLGHWAQGLGAMMIIVLFAVAFHVLVRMTGDLYTAIVVHVIYDFIAGVLLWIVGRARRSSVRT